MKRRPGHDLTLIAGLAVFAFSASTLAQPKLELRTAKPAVNHALQVKGQPRGRGAYVTSDELVALSSDGQTDIASLSLPPGDYLVLAKAVVVNDAGSPAAVACGLHAGNYAPASGRTGIDYASVTVAARSRTALTLTGTYANGTPLPRSLRVSCQASSGKRLVARWIRLTALAVESVHTEGGAKSPSKRARPVRKRRAR